MATLRKRGAAYNVQVRKRTPAGKLICASATKRTRAEAQRWARALESEIESGAYTSRHHAQRELTLETVLNRYRKNVTNQKRGAVQEGQHINVMLRDTELVDTRMRDLTPAVIEDWTLRQPQSAATVDRRLNILSRAVRYGIRVLGARTPQGNPVRQIEREPAPESDIGRAIEPAELRAIKCELRRHVGELPILQFALIASETGARRGELCKLDWQHVDLKAGRHGAIHLITGATKAGKFRPVPLTRVAKFALESLPGKRQGLVFGNHAPWSYSRAFAAAVKRAGVAHCRMHDLRHTRATKLADRGLTYEQSKTIIGHSSRRMSEHYQHLDALKVAEKFGL